jgi:hypothetical protein
MGILDDAIREHLDLKRKHGADDDDVERLEKEAFGPPVRPGDPEFEGEEGADSDAGGEPEGSGAPESGTGDWADVLDENTEDHAETAEPAAEPDDDADELSAAEQARIEHTDLDDTVDHPAVPETGEEPPVAEAPAETEPAPAAELPPSPEGEPGEPVEPAEAAIFEQSDDFDLELELDDEPEAAQDPAQPATEPAPADPAAAGFEADDAEADELEDEDEDLLEETPDFLEDTPEGERLWFEQGEPKDFDFDD